MEQWWNNMLNIYFPQREKRCATQGLGLSPPAATPWQPWQPLRPLPMAGKLHPAVARRLKGWSCLELFGSKERRTVNCKSHDYCIVNIWPSLSILYQQFLNVVVQPIFKRHGCLLDVSAFVFQASKRSLIMNSFLESLWSELNVWEGASVCVMLLSRHVEQTDSFPMQLTWGETHSNPTSYQI